jgi:Na+/H+ antiporter NhaD/arsenite permease-like protein
MAALCPLDAAAARRCYAARPAHPQDACVPAAFHDAVIAVTLLAFAATYAGMALGRVPGLAIDRTGIALLAAVALILTGAIPAKEAAGAIDISTLIILLGLMVLSSQFGLAGFYDWCAARIAAAAGSPSRLLALTVAAAGGLSAVLANDVVVFAMTPLLCRGVRARGLDPRPFLLALAGGSNAGSAATVIGNPQNILIGQVGQLDFWRFAAVCGPPALLAMVAVFLALKWAWAEELGRRPERVALPAPELDLWQTAKGVIATAILIAAFATPLPRELAVLGVAALLLVSRRLATRRVMAQVDWHLLLLFAALFVVNAAMARTGLPAEALAWLGRHGLLPDRLGVLLPLTLAMSNTVGNVPAVVMILGLWPSAPEGALYGLALLSTLAGNFLLVGSIANIIVAERAAAEGVRLGFADFARAGVPMTLAVMPAAALWLSLGGWIGW